MTDNKTKKQLLIAIEKADIKKQKREEIDKICKKK